MKFHCPHCKQRIETDLKMAGEKANCPECAIEIKVPEVSIRPEKPATAFQKHIVKNYKGSPIEAEGYLLRDIDYYSRKGYSPIKEHYQDGQWKCGYFVVALLLCFAYGIGFFMFLYLIIIKPVGSLTVTFGLNNDPVKTGLETRLCPMCAEEVKQAALVCKHCSHTF